MPPQSQACPSCRAPTDQQHFERQIYGEVILDICWDCRAIWFDQYESAQMAAGGVISLFRLIHDHRNQPARALADSMGCPRCQARLVFTHDLQRTNQLTYYRCPAGHGRLTTFFQFLREKQFVRSLSKPEIEQLRASVSQVRCSSCGAFVDLARDSVCPYCRAPVSVLDSDAVDKALAAFHEAERQRSSVNADEISAAFGSIQAARRDAPLSSPWTLDLASMRASAGIADLVAEGIARLFVR